MATTTKKTTANKVNTTKKVNYTYNPTKETATQYNARIASERGDTAKELNSMQNATQTAFKEKGLDVNKLTSTSIQQSSPWTPPEKPIPENPGNLVASGNAGVVTGMEDATLDENSLIQRLDNGTLKEGDALRYALANTPEPVNQEKAYYKSKEYKTVNDAQKQVNDYTAQLNQITAQSNAQQLALEGQGRGQTEAFIGGEQARINREAAIAALPIQAQLAAAQGNLEFAQKQLDTVFTLRMQDAQNKYKYETDKLNSIVSFLDKAETRQYNARLQAEERKYTTAQNNINYLRQLSAQAREYGNTSVIGQLGAIDPASPTFEQDVARVAQGIRKPVSGVDAPDLQNFGTADNPDWRQFNPITGSWDEIDGVGTSDGVNMSKVQRAKVSESVAANKELNGLISEYKTLLDDVGFEGSTLGGENLGKFKALKGRMTTVLKKAETLGTLDKGVTDLVDQLVGEIPEKSGLTQNFLGFKSRQISSQLATQMRLIQEKINADETRLGGGSVFSLTTSDLSELDELFGETANTTDSDFDPSEYF